MRDDPGASKPGPRPASPPSRVLRSGASFITPPDYESWFGLPSKFNQFVADWLATLRAAVTAATGREPGPTPAAQLPGESKWRWKCLVPVPFGATKVQTVAMSAMLITNHDPHSFHTQR